MGSIKQKTNETTDKGKVQRLDASGSMTATSRNSLTVAGRINSTAATSESGDLRSNEDPQRCETGYELGKSSSKGKQKYLTDYIHFFLERG